MGIHLGHLDPKKNMYNVNINHQSCLAENGSILTGYPQWWQFCVVVFFFSLSIVSECFKQPNLEYPFEEARPKLPSELVRAYKQSLSKNCRLQWQTSAS